MIKNIIFDMGNVLLDYNPQVSLDLFCQTEEEKTVIRRELFEGPEWIQGDLGNMTDDEKYESVRARVPDHMHPALKQCVYGWAICMQPLPGAKDFCMFARQKGYRLYVLSNANVDFYEYFPRFARLQEFDGIVVSSDVHIVKPDIRIYRYLLDKYQLEPQECLFLDDREDNVLAAREVGMLAEQFQGDFDFVQSKYHL